AGPGGSSGARGRVCGCERGCECAGDAAGSAERVKLLIVRVGALGDVLHALPAAAALRMSRPDWTIDWVVDPRWAPLLVNDEGHGEIVDRVHLAETKMWSAAPFSWKTLRSVAKLRRGVLREL